MAPFPLPFGLLSVMPGHGLGLLRCAFASACPVGSSDLKPSKPAGGSGFSRASAAVGAGTGGGGGAGARNGGVATWERETGARNGCALRERGRRPAKSWLGSCRRTRGACANGAGPGAVGGVAASLRLASPAPRPVPSSRQTPAGLGSARFPMRSDCAAWMTSFESWYHTYAGCF